MRRPAMRFSLVKLFTFAVLLACWGANVVYGDTEAVLGELRV
jgi:hypothetical protein